MKEETPMQSSVSKIEHAYNGFITPVEHQLRMWGLPTPTLAIERDETGAIAVPWAAATAAGVGLVVVVVAIMVLKATSQSENIPDTIVVPGG